MATTISGHTALRNYDPRLKRAFVPGRPVWLRTHRNALPLFLRLGVLMDQVEQLKLSDTWSYAYRAGRMSKDISDHAGWAVDFWSARIGAHTWPSKMPADKAAQISAILSKFRTPDGRLIFLWGISHKSPGVVYPESHTYSSTTANDPMHFAIAPGITVADLKATQKAMRIKDDGTVA